MQTHDLTADEAAQMMLTTGVYVNGTDYNVIIDGHGTGLAPPTSAQYSAMVGNVTVTDTVTTGLMSASLLLHLHPALFPSGRRPG